MCICLSLHMFVFFSICLSVWQYIYLCVWHMCLCVFVCARIICANKCVLAFDSIIFMILFRFFSSLYYHYDNCCICVSVYLCVFLCVCVVCNLFSVLTLCTHNYYCSYDIMFMCVFMCVFLCVCVLFTYMCVLHYVLIIFLRHSHSQFRSTVFVKIFLSFSLFFSILITLKITILIFVITSTIYLWFLLNDLLFSLIFILILLLEILITPVLSYHYSHWCIIITITIVM